MFFSHPNKLLIEHLKEVAQSSKSSIAYVLPNAELQKAAYIAGAYHDFGKYTSFFQQRLVSGKRNPYSGHSLLSSLLAASVAYENLRDEYFPLAVFLVVRSHHGELEGASNAFNELYDLLDEEDRHSILMKQLGQLKSSEQEILKEVNRLEYPLASIPSDVDDIIQKLKKDARRFAVEAEENWDRFFLTELLFSSLIDSDKKSAAGLSSKQVCIPKVSELGRKIELLPKSGNLLLDEYRSLLQRLVLERVSQGGFTYIISPTGTGKTMAGLLAAVKKGKRRLIYALPYINIVEQTHSALARALGSDSLEVLLKYHHLAIPYIASRASEEQIELDKLLLMADSWDSYAVVTTFEGLFASLVSSKNLLLKKLHNIAGSVLILDEVQAIPMEYWKLVKDVLIRASKLLNIDVILMTATMPSMFLRGSGLDSVIEPVGLPPLNRYVLRFNGGNMSADELAERFLAKWDMRTSSLIVLNTVRSAERVYLNIKEALGDKVRILTSSSENALDKPWITYLSDHVVPYERKKRIDRIKDEMKKGTPVVLVSTQVVEAGVDLDFGYAIRDFGPLDSIVQVAGRCNRNASKERSVVDVFYVNTDNKTDFSKIYGAALEDATVDVLDHEAKFNMRCSGTHEVSEEELPLLMSSFNNLVVDRKDLENSDKSLSVERKVMSLDFDTNVSLIEDEAPWQVFVELNDDATKSLLKLRDLIESDGQDPYARHAELRRARADFEEFVVRSWTKLNRLENALPGYDIQLIDRSQIHNFYAEDIGLMVTRKDEVRKVI